MPEGPEVRRYADRLHKELAGQPIQTITARTKAAKAWLAENGDSLAGCHVASVRSHGKNLVGRIEGGFWFYSHLMMWGRWEIHSASVEISIDRRERARIAMPDTIAVLMSAPVFEIGAGDPYRSVPYLAELGPDILPYPDEPPFDEAAFLHRLLAPEVAARAVGAILLDQTIVAGIGNYLRAEILFQCRLDPWKMVGDLTASELEQLVRAVPEITQRAYQTGGYTVPDELRDRMRTDPTLTYSPGSEWGTRHYTFRRTNLPCLVCGDVIRQKRQVTHADEEGEKERIIYFCPTCQKTTVELKPLPKKRKPRAEPAPAYPMPDFPTTQS